MINIKTSNMIKYTKRVVTILIVLVFSGCTDLDEKIYSSIPADKFYNNENEIIMAMGRAYTHLRGGNANIWGLIGTNTVASDEAIIPFREQNLWWDGGYWIDLHRHQFYDALWPVIDSWDFIFQGVTLCNKLILQIEESPVTFEGKDGLVAELKILRAYYFYHGIDLFGGIPMSTDFENTELPTITDRKSAFEFIVNDINENIGLLQDYSSPETYGRATKSVGYAILAKLYINSEEWTGTARWDEAKAACDAIINMNHYILEPDYFSNFSPTNENSQENIFVIPFDRITTTGWYNNFLMHCFTLHSLSSQTFGFSAFTWDGIAATEEQYNLYDSNDSRINSWMEGPQFSAGGDPLMISQGRQLTYRPKLASLYDVNNLALLDDGVRCQKWAFEPGLLDDQSMSNDWTIFRYADILLIKAEAIMRKNGGSANGEALALVNQVRERAYGNANNNYTSLDLPELLNERGRELAWEGQRRQDQIRFGTWGNAWFKKTASSEHLKLYPIPFTALSTNNKLEQNPGY